MTWMNPELVMQTEGVSLQDKNKHHILMHTCVHYVQMILFAKQK